MPGSSITPRRAGQRAPSALPRWLRAAAVFALLGWSVLFAVFGPSFGVALCGLIALAIMALAGSYRLQQAGYGGRWLPRLGSVLYGCALLWLLSLCLLLRLIFSEPQGEVAADTTHVIVLGAGLRNGDQLSLILQARLDQALAMLRQHPHLQVIVSGGQGVDEKLSEAAAMQRYLQQHGIAAARIVQENRSTTTRENLRFSQRLLPRSDSRVVVLSSDVHIYRAQRIAYREGLNSSAMAAAMPFWVLLNYATREYFALLKDFYGT